MATGGGATQAWPASPVAALPPAAAHASAQEQGSSAAMQPLPRRPTRWSRRQHRTAGTPGTPELLQIRLHQLILPFRAAPLPFVIRGQAAFAVAVRPAAAATVGGAVAVAGAAGARPVAAAAVIVVILRAEAWAVARQEGGMGGRAAVTRALCAA